MEEDKQSNYSSLIFILLVGVFILVLQYSHISFSFLSPDQQKRVVLIYDTLNVKKIVAIPNLDSTVFDQNEFLDTLNIKADSLLAARNSSAIVITETAQTELMISDSSYFSKLIASSRERKSKPVVRYFTKPNDEKKIYSLRKFGYYIHERSSPMLTEFSSNAIYYGDSIKKEDLELIVYVLINEGVGIKEISASKYSWKYNAVEIGTDTTIMKRQNISIPEIRNKLSDL